MTTIRRATVTWLAANLASAPCVASPLRAQVPGELRGRLTDARSLRPIAEGRIEIGGRAEVIRSRADGTFLIRGLDARQYAVRVRALGYVERSFDVEIANGRSTSIEVPLEPAVAELRGVLVRAERDSAVSHETTFDRRAIEASGRRDIGELLQTTSGLVITQSGGPGTATRASIRGSGANEVLVLIDGVPANSGVSGEADLSQLTLENVERVTVRTGARSARYGGRALAGVIDIQTRRPSREASALLRTGAWGERNAASSLGGRWPAGTWRIGGSATADYRTVRGDFPYERPVFRGGGTAQRINSDVTSRQVAAALSLEDGERSGGLRAAWQDLSRGLAGSIVQPSATGRQGNARASAGMDGRLQLGWLSWSASGDATHERTTFVDPQPPFGTRFDDTVRATGVTASTSVSVDRGPLAVSLGGETRTLNIESTLLEAEAPRTQRLLGAWGNVRGSHLFEGGRMLFDGDVSARLDHNSLARGSIFSPRIALRLSRGLLAISASLGMGFAPPSLADQFFHEGVLVRPSPGLRPERTRGDVETRLTVQEHAFGPFVLAGDAAVYRADIDGMILWQPDFRYIWSPSNFDVHRSGWELSTRGAVPDAHLDVQGTFNRSDVSYSGPVLGGQVAYRPRSTASMTIGYTPGRRRVELTNRLIGERRTVPGSPINTLSAYWLTDLRVRTSLVRPSFTTDATLGLDNLFDRTAAMLVDYPFPGRTWALSLRFRRTRQP